MDRNIVKLFWKCGDIDIINLACDRAGLTTPERQTLNMLLTDCKTQEETAEELGISTRKVQELWYSSCNKILQIYWVHVIAHYIFHENSIK